MKTLVIALMLCFVCSLALAETSSRGDYTVNTGDALANTPPICATDAEIESVLDNNGYVYHTHDFDVDRDNPMGTYIDLEIVKWDQASVGVKSFQDYVNEEYSVYAGVTISLPEFIPALDFRKKHADSVTGEDISE